VSINLSVVDECPKPPMGAGDVVNSSPPGVFAWPESCWALEIPSMIAEGKLPANVLNPIYQYVEKQTNLNPIYQ
jgi:hypothetical protein